MARIINTQSKSSTTNGEGFAAIATDTQTDESKRGQQKRTDSQGPQKSYTAARMGAQLTITIEL